MKTYLNLFLYTFLVFLLTCAHNGDWAKRLDWKEYELASLPGEKEYPDAGAIIILDEGKMEVSTSSQLPTSLFERHRIVKILNSQGQHYANITIPYAPGSEIESIQARTISPSGEIKVINKHDIYDVTLYPRFIFYSDQRAKIFTMPAVENGAVVEYRYRMRTRGRSVWPSWNFQDFVPTLKSRFNLAAPGEWEVNYRHYNIDLEVVVDEAPEGFKSSYTWEIADVPALKSEFGMPSLKNCVARLEIAPVGMDTWDDVAQWYHELSEPQLKPGKEIKELALSLTSGIENDEQKLRAIYEWVRDRVRYIAVAIGIGGFQPHPANDIFDNRYGDCKDMSTLICSLARATGIEAYQVLVSTWQNGAPDTSLPSPFQFNHTIAYCPSIRDSGLWMDATEKGCPFGELPWYDQGLPMLVVKKNGDAEIITTFREPADSNRTLFDWTVELQSNGAAIVRGKSEYRGAFASELRELLYFTRPEGRRQWLETYLASRCSGAKLDSFQISGLNPVEDPLIVNYAFQTKTFALDHSGEMTFCPGKILAFELPDFFRSAQRVHPIQFRFGMLDELQLTVKMPAGWKIKTAISPDSLLTAFGSASWFFTADDSSLHIDSTCLINGNAIDPGEFHEFQNFLDGVDKRNLREVVLSKISK